MIERTLVSSENVTLSTLVTGLEDGPTILLSNSLGTGLEMWAPQRKILEKHYRVIGYDTRGHGSSSSPDGPYSFEDLTLDALAVLDHFGVERADYIGLSLGGMTGLGLGLSEPDRFNKIVCACARADAPEPFASSWDRRVAEITAGGMAAIWTATLERWLTPRFISENPEVVTKLKKDFLATSVNGYSGCAAALKSLDYLTRLGDLSVPLLFISGAADMGAPSQVMRVMWMATPGGSYEDIPDCAHIANLNQEEAFNRVLKFFLEFK